MENIKQHTFALTHYTYKALSALKYTNGAPVVRIYTTTDFSNPDTQGPIINFNVLDEDGEIVGYSQVHVNISLFLFSFFGFNVSLWLFHVLVAI